MIGVLFGKEGKRGKHRRIGFYDIKRNRAFLDRLIPIGLMIGLLIPLRKKVKENPESKSAGIPLKTVIVIIYIGIAINVLLILFS